MSRRPHFKARQAARRERIRETRLEADPLHQFSPRVLLILGGICTLLAGGFIFSVIDGVWLGMAAFGALAIATGAAVAGLKATGKIADARGDARWIEVEEDLVRAEKVEQFGHTAGGLSEATDAKAGQLSEPE